MTKKKVLLIEDDADIREVLKAALADGSYDLLDASDGEVGLQTAFTQHPDLILLDLLLPKKDGIAVLKELRGDTWGEHVPVVIFTNYSTDDKMFSTLAEYTPSYYFVKSDMSIQEVAEKVQEILNEQPV